MSFDLTSALGLMWFAIPGIFGLVLGATGIRVLRRDGKREARTWASWLGGVLVLLGCVLLLFYAPFVVAALEALRL